MVESRFPFSEQEQALLAAIGTVDEFIASLGQFTAEANEAFLRALDRLNADLDTDFAKLEAMVVAAGFPERTLVDQILAEMFQLTNVCIDGAMAACTELCCPFDAIDPDLADEQDAAEAFETGCPVGIPGSPPSLPNGGPSLPGGLPSTNGNGQAVDPTPQWSVWDTGSETRVCYVQTFGAPPLEPEHESLGSFSTAVAAQERADACGSFVPIADLIDALLPSTQVGIPNLFCSASSYNDVHGVFEGPSSEIEIERIDAEQSAFEALLGRKLTTVNLELKEGVALGVTAARAAMMLSAPGAAMVQNTRIGYGDECTDKFNELKRFNTIRAFLHSLSVVTGSQADDAALPMDYAARSLCPTAFPNGDQATDSYLANSIDAETRDAWWRLNNLCEEPQKRVLESRRSKLSPGELLALWRRDFWGSDGAAELNKHLRAIGYLKPDDYAGLQELSRQVPQSQELVRFMVRDAGNKEIVEEFKLDTQFDTNFLDNPQMKAWAKAQGVTDEHMRFIWRSHWRLPGPQAMSEMLHRFSRLPEGDPLRTTKEMVDRALRQDDFLPFWIPRMIGISFRPLSRIDIRRAFRIGAIDKAQMIEANQQNGMSPENANILADFTELERNRGVFNTLPMKLWKRFAITPEDAENRMIALGFDLETYSKAFVDLSHTMESNPPMSRFVKGLQSVELTETELSRHGIPEDVYKRWISEAEKELKNLPTQIQLRKGLATADEARDAFNAMGYKAATVERLIVDSVKDLANHPAQGAYLAGVYDEPKALEAMRIDGIPNFRGLRLLGMAELDQQVAFTRKCAEAIVDRFDLGELAAEDLAAELTNLGMAAAVRDQWVQRAVCERKSKSRLPSVATLCDWLERGALGPGQFVIRLTRMGFTDFDAQQILVDCIARIDTKRAKEAAALAKKEAKELLRQEKIAKLTAKELARQQAQAEKARALAAKARQRRRILVLKAADKLRAQDDIELAEAETMITEAVSDFRDKLGLTIDQAIELAVRTVEGRLKADPLPWDERIAQVIETTEPAPPEGVAILS